jgi:hypothetical protein
MAARTRTGGVAGVVGAVALVALTLGWLCARAQAQEPKKAGGPPISLEFHSGWHDPMGLLGLALVYAPPGRFSGGVELSLESWPIHSQPPVGLFGRARLLSAGPLSLGVVAALSREHEQADRIYDRPPIGAYLQESLRWEWKHGYRAAGALAGELAGRHWHLRLEVGLGFLLNDPTCIYSNPLTSFAGDCRSPEIPSVYQFSVPPGRVIPSVTTVLGYQFGVKDPVSDQEATAEERYRSPETALQYALLSPLILIVSGAVLLDVSSRGGDRVWWGGIATMALGLTVGPSIGHIYAGEYVHGWGMALLRAVTLTYGSYMAIASLVGNGDCEDGPPGSCDSHPGEWGLALGLLLITPATAIYDIIDAPSAARRANDRHGFVDNLHLVPVVAPSGGVSQHLLAFAGQF